VSAAVAIIVNNFAMSAERKVFTKSVFYRLESKIKKKSVSHKLCLEPFVHCAADGII